MVDQWHGPEATFVKVQADDGHLYILLHSSAADEWSLTPSGAFSSRDWAAILKRM